MRNRINAAFVARRRPKRSAVVGNRRGGTSRRPSRSGRARSVARPCVGARWRHDRDRRVRHRLPQNGQVRHKATSRATRFRPCQLCADAVHPIVPVASVPIKRQAVASPWSRLASRPRAHNVRYNVTPVSSDIPGWKELSCSFMFQLLSVKGKAILVSSKRRFVIGRLDIMRDRKCQPDAIVGDAVRTSAARMYGRTTNAEHRPRRTDARQRGSDARG